MSDTSCMRIPLEAAPVAQAAAVACIKHQCTADLIALRVVASPAPIHVRLIANRDGDLWWKTGPHDGAPRGLFGEHAVTEGVLHGDMTDDAVQTLACDLVDRIVAEVLNDGSADELDALIGGVPSAEHVDPSYDAFAAVIDAREAELNATTQPAGLAIRIRRGSEGPKHDPYAFTQYDVRTPDGRRIVYRAGLAEWMSVNGVVMADGPGCSLRFEALVGYDLDQLDWWEDAPYRGVPCMACTGVGCRGGCVV